MSLFAVGVVWAIVAVAVVGWEVHQTLRNRTGEAEMFGDQIKRQATDIGYMAALIVLLLVTERFRGEQGFLLVRLGGLILIAGVLATIVVARKRQRANVATG